MEKENSKQDNLKIVFALISLFLMVPPLINADGSYYRTLFIFLINRVIDMFFRKKKNESNFFIVWSLVNQWTGVIACAIAFCSIEPEFAAVCVKYKEWINVGLFTAAVSCVLREMTVLVVQSIKEQLVKEKIKCDVSQMEG